MYHSSTYHTNDLYENTTKIINNIIIASRSFDYRNNTSYGKQMGQIQKLEAL